MKMRRTYHSLMMMRKGLTLKLKKNLIKSSIKLVEVELLMASTILMPTMMNLAVKTWKLVMIRLRRKREEQKGLLKWKMKKKKGKIERLKRE